MKRMAELETPTKRIEIGEAIELYLRSKSGLEPGTLRNYRRTLHLFHEISLACGLKYIDQAGVETVDAFREKRSTLSPLSWSKELQILRGFFHFAVDRDWLLKNPAKLVAQPRNLKPAPKEPYTQEEIIRILAACDSFGRNSYERLRARAMVLLLRYTALRISDVALLERARIRNGRIHVRTQKRGEPVLLDVAPELAKALDSLPEPKGGNGRFFFWSGNGDKRAAIRGATRTLATVFERSGVLNAHPHRFRHTLATEMLECGGSEEDVAVVLGNSAAIVRKHYGLFSVKRQERIQNLLQTVFSGTNLAQTENPSATDSKISEFFGGRHGIRTHDPGVANAVLSQLS